MPSLPASWYAIAHAGELFLGYLFRLSRRRRRLCGILIVFSSVFLFFSQVVFPFLHVQVSAQTAKPVPDDYFDRLALRRIDTFSFDELRPQGSLAWQDSVADDEPIPTSFLLTIPKLGLKDVKIETNSVDTTPFEMLGHYKGSSLPGRPGNTFIYGHSTLPSYYNPKNYKTLFTFLPKLEKGDEVSITYNDHTFTYLVERKEIFEPEKLDPLMWKNLPYSSLALMTCVPPGTTDKREVVLAKQIY